MSDSDRFRTHVAVFLIVRNDSDEILLQKRQNTSYLDGYWDFPSGHVEYGESIHEAACRELQEEVGVTARPEDLRLVHVNQNFLDTPYMNFMFEALQWQSQPKVNEPDKVAEVAFFAPADLPEKCTLGVRVYEQAGFTSEPTYSFVDDTNFQEVMHEAFNPSNWGKV